MRSYKEYAEDNETEFGKRRKVKSKMSTSSTSKEAIVLAAVAVLALTPVLFGVVALSAIINGWVLSILWGWFIVPVFNIPAISVEQAIGLAMVVSYLTYQHINADSKRKSKGESTVELFVALLARPLITLLFGYILHLFL